MSFRKSPLVVAAAVALGLGAGQVVAQDEAQQEQQEQKPAKVQPVDFRKLKEVPPESVAGIKRTNLEGQKISMGEFTLSTASAEYSPESDAENPPYASMEIQDWGGSPEMAAAQAAWAQMEIDSEGDDGFQRTVKLQGKYPAMLNYANDGQSGDAHIYVAERFIVTLNVSNVSGEQFIKAAEELPLDNLAALKE